jgi:hypothetical protein
LERGKKKKIAKERDFDRLKKKGWDFNTIEKLKE